MDEFEILPAAEQDAVERFVKFQIQSREDAGDVLQEVYLTACRNQDCQLRVQNNS